MSSGHHGTAEHMSSEVMTASTDMCNLRPDKSISIKKGGRHEVLTLAEERWQLIVAGERVNFLIRCNP